MPVQDPLKEPNSSVDKDAPPAVVPCVPRPGRGVSEGAAPLPPTNEAQGPQLPSTDEVSVERLLEVSPAVDIVEGDDEPEDTAVGKVTAQLLALSARPPPMADNCTADHYMPDNDMAGIDFEEKTQAFTAPQELLEMARRQRDAVANGEVDPEGHTIVPIDGPASSIIPLVNVKGESQAGAGEDFSALRVPDSARAGERGSGRLAVETVNTVVAPPVPASRSSIAPELSVQDSEPRSERLTTGTAMEVWVFVGLACVLAGYWLSVFL